MVKKLLRIVLVVVLVVILGLVALWMYIDRVAAAALTRGVEYAGEVPCKVEKVSVSLLGGSVGVKGLAIRNPKDFPEADMFALQQADVKVRTRSLWNQPVHVETLEIVQPLVRLEGGLGKSNVQVFLSNVKRKVGGEAGPAEKPEGEPTRLIVDRLLLKDATVQFGSGISSASIASVKLKTVEMVDIRGRDGKGVTSGELAAKIVYELVRRGAIEGDFDLGRFVSQDVGQAFEKAAKKAEEVLQKVTSPLDKLLKPKKDSEGGD